MGVLPVNKKEGKRRGKNDIGPRIKMDVQTVNKIQHLQTVYYCRLCIKRGTHQDSILGIVHAGIIDQNIPPGLAVSSNEWHVVCGT